MHSIAFNGVDVQMEKKPLLALELAPSNYFKH